MMLQILLHKKKNMEVQRPAKKEAQTKEQSAGGGSQHWGCDPEEAAQHTWVPD